MSHPDYAISYQPLFTTERGALGRPLPGQLIEGVSGQALQGPAKR
jgi:hypothetical protein